MNLIARKNLIEMKLLATLGLWLICLPILAQDTTDTTRVILQAVDSTGEQVEAAASRQTQELIKNVKEQSGPTVARDAIKTIREDLDQVDEELKAEEKQAEKVDNIGLEVVDKTKETFLRIWNAMKEGLRLENLIPMIVMLFLGLLVNHLLKRWIGTEENTPQKVRLRRLRWYPAFRLTTWTIVIVTIAALLLKDPEAFWPALTALAIGLGLAIKDGLSNMLGGLRLIFEQPYQIGDRIQVGEHYGEVTRIGLRSTQITTLDDNLVTIPNARILNDSVSNANAGETHCMAVVRIWLPLNMNLDLARTTAHEAAITSRFFNFDKGVKILFQDHIEEPSGTIMKIKAYVLDAKYEKAFEADVTETVKRVFVASGVY